MSTSIHTCPFEPTSINTSHSPAHLYPELSSFHNNHILHSCPPLFTYILSHWPLFTSPLSFQPLFIPTLYLQPLFTSTLSSSPLLTSTILPPSIHIHLPLQSLFTSILPFPPHILLFHPPQHTFSSPPLSITSNTLTHLYPLHSIPSPFHHYSHLTLSSHHYSHLPSLPHHYSHLPSLSQLAR